MALNDFKDTNQGGEGVLTVSNSNIGKGIKWNPDTKQYEVDIVDLTPINNSIDRLSNEVQSLQNKPDKDTVYDDTSLRNELTSLRALVDSIQNTGTTPNVKYFKVPISISYDENPNVQGESTDCSVSYTINENINNIQAIEGIGIITRSYNGHSLSVNMPLKITKKNNTSILVESTFHYPYSISKENAHGLIILYLK